MTDTSPEQFRAEDRAMGVAAAAVDDLDSNGVGGSDEKGRPILATMTDRALLIEIAANMRACFDAVESLESLPIVAAMRNGQNPLMAMMGR